MKLKFCGAVSSVTGSCHLLTTEQHKVLLDCGLYQGGKTLEQMNEEPFPFVPSEIECVILSHAHVDHCGRLPLLVKQGFSGPIYCTDATADLLHIMLPDCAHIQEKETEWANRKADRLGKPHSEPLYTMEDAQETLMLVQPILYDQLFQVNDQMRAVFNDAGHILGSAITELWIEEGEKTTKLVYTGDIGVEERPILRNPVKIKKADVVVMEATYGSRLHESNEHSLQELIQIIVKTVKRGGNVIIPSFAVGRTQELIYELNRFYEANDEYRDFLKRVQVYIDSPMAISTTQVFRRNAQVFDDETKRYILEGDTPLDFPNLNFSRTSQDSMALNSDEKPKIIIAASGMCDAGRICHHLKHNLWNRKNSIVFVGYQANGTLGRRILDGEKEVSVLGEKINVQAEIYNLEGFSGHADRDGLLSWVKGLQKAPKNIFLVHGEDESKEALEALILEETGYPCTAVHGVTEVDLSEIEGMTLEEVERDIVDEEKIMQVRDKLYGIHEVIEDILYSANLAVGEQIPTEKLVQISNVIMQLEKETLNLGMAVTKEAILPEKSGVAKDEE
ncbi:MAG: MBL fold metallo-hydrolase [Lachnospiraceae bacterium]|nr:MBL fold metallo-hydrolase [Lachnospiraceae bacterium]